MQYASAPWSTFHTASKNLSEAVSSHLEAENPATLINNLAVIGQLSLLRKLYRALEGA